MRRRTRRSLLLALVAVVVLIAAFVIDTLYVAGAFKHIAPHFGGRCAPVAVTGVEDMAALDDGHVFLSSDDRRATLAGHPTPGAIFLYDLSGATPPRNLTLAGAPELHPHGISYWPIAPGRGRLFVVNHPDGMSMAGGGRHAIEVFDWNDGALAHRTTLTGPALESPNDVVAVSPETFYVTNDHGSQGLARTFEDWLRLARASVVYYDGKSLRRVADDIVYANGIDVSADGKSLYVAATTGRSLLVYDRDPATGALANRRDIALGTAPDNIERAADGHLWIAAHPKLLAFVAHAKDPAAKSPSQVLEVTLQAGGGAAVTEVLLDDGTQLSGSSVALRSGTHLLVGPVFADHFLDCSMP